MLEELYMRDLANAMRMPEEVVPAGKVTVSAPDPEMAGMDKAFVGTRLNVPKPGQPTQQDREKMAIGLLDTLAGALRGAAAQVGGLPGDIRSILDMINQEGAEKYLGQRSFATTEEILKDTSVRIPGTQIDVPFPPVLKEGVPNRAERQKAVEVAQEVGTFLPAPGIPEAVIQGGKLVGKAIKATKNMPIGMSTQAVGQGMDELGFYSAAKQAVDAIQQPKGTGAQFLAQISKTPGVKPDEIKWTGLDEFLQSKKSVTKAEVQEYLDKNRVQIKETTVGDININQNSPYALPEVVKVIKDNQGSSNYSMRLSLENDYNAYNALIKKFPNLEETDNWGDRVLDEIIGSSGGTKFSKYTLPGGENYREILLTLPPSKIEVDKWNVIRPDGISDGFYSSEKFAMDRANAIGGTVAERPGRVIEGGFMSQHFDQPNILAHLRVNDRVIDGKKTLFVEEVQSDWHQAGRKKGYAQDVQKQLAKINEERAALVAEKSKVLDEAAPFTDKGMDAPQDLLDRFTMADDRLAALQAQQNRLGQGVPDAPFKTTWSDLSMKRVIQMASEGGYDRIAFTTGKTQAERFDLSKQINDITIARNKTNFVITATNKDGLVAINQSIPDLRNLDEIVGKDLAEKVKDDFANKSGNEHNYAGLDLQVGGEGMKGFYDDILPKFLDKYAKKWDAKTGVTEMLTERGAGSSGMPSMYPDKVPVNYIDVTPKMRESVVTKGQPMFAIGAGGAGAAATQEENE
jgi:hypothetical protein